MNNQQNIDDILKLLKSSYNDGEAPKPETAEDNADKEGALSEAELQERLRKQFMSAEDEKNISDGDASDEFSYNIDNDFLSEGFAEEEIAEEVESFEDSEAAVELEAAEAEPEIEAEPEPEIEKETEEEVLELLAC